MRRAIGTPIHVKKAADALIFTNGKNLGGIKRGGQFEELSDDTLDGAMRDTVFEMRQTDFLYEYEDTIVQEEREHTTTAQTYQADLSFPGPQDAQGKSETDLATASMSTSFGQAAASSSGLCQYVGQMSASTQATSTSSCSGQSKVPWEASSVDGGQMSTSAAAVLIKQQGQGVTTCQPQEARSANAGMTDEEALTTAIAASLVSRGSQMSGGHQGQVSESDTEEDHPGECHLCGGDYYYQVTGY